MKAEDKSQGFQISVRLQTQPKKRSSQKQKQKKKRGVFPRKKQ
jgi:hypothetical protein